MTTCGTVEWTSLHHRLLVNLWSNPNFVLKKVDLFILPRQMRQRCLHPYISEQDAAAIPGHAYTPATNGEPDATNGEPEMH